MGSNFVEKTEIRLRREDWDVRPVSITEARNLVEAHHYAKGASNTGVFIHGLYSRRDNSLAGIAWWLPPTRVAAESVNRERWRQVLSLTRMVIVPGAPKNACSFLLSRSIKAIREDGRFLSLVTWADEGEGHLGGVYRASNWTYVGANSGDDRWIDPTTGRHVARKAGRKSRTAAEMAAMGYVRIGKSRKHKFVIHLPLPKRNLSTSDQRELFSTAA